MVGRQRSDEPDNRRNDVLLVLREDREGRSEHGRDHAAADEALERAPDDHFLDRGRGRAEDAHQREARRRDHEQIAGRKRARQEPRKRDHDDFGDEVARLHPGDFVGAGGDAGLDFGERGRDDLNVEDRHEHAEDHGDERHDAPHRDCGSAPANGAAPAVAGMVCAVAAMLPWSSYSESAIYTALSSSPCPSPHGREGSSGKRPSWADASCMAL